MSHLGSRLSALVDGHLGPEDAERVMAHAAVCAECAAELTAARQTRRALNAAHVTPAPDLTARLLALHPAARPGDPGQAPRPWSDSAGFADSVRLPGERAPFAGCLRGDVAGTRGLPALLGVAGCLALVLVGLVLLGDRQAVAPQLHRAHALRVLAEAVDLPLTASAVIAGDAAGGAAPAPSGVVLEGERAQADARDWLSDHGWVAPAELPEGWTIAAVRLDVHRAGDLELDLEGPQGTVVVLQQRGRLAASAIRDLPTLEVDGRTVHVASRDPWHVVWQCGDVVVDVLAEGPVDAVRDIVAVHPDDQVDDGVPARIARGWSVLAGAWAP